MQRNSPHNDRFVNEPRKQRVKLGQCSRIRILRVFQISKKRDFLGFFEMTYQKVVKSLAKV